MLNDPIGARQPVIDARLRVTGQGSFVGDLKRPETLHGAVLRSTTAHARIVGIDTSAARDAPGVRVVVSGADVPGAPERPRLFGQLIRDTPILAIDRIRYAGEPVAAVAAVDQESAEAALALIRVDVEPLEPFFDANAALAEGVRALHGDSNLLEERRLQVGDMAAAFAAAGHVVEETFEVPPVQAVPLETHVVLAEWTRDAIVVHATTQTPFHVRRELAALFDLPVERVRVVAPMLGGGFGAKAYPRIEPLAVLLAAHAGRPVRLELSRAEEFVTVQRQAATVSFATAVDPEGRLLGQRASCTFNAGAYTDNAPRIIRHALYSLAGPYRIPALDLLVRAVHTNNPPCGPLRAPGTAQVQWAREAHIDAVASAVAIEALDLRRRNLVTDSDRFILGGPMGPVHLPELLDAVEQPRAPRDGAGMRRRGVGYGIAFKTTNTPSTSEAEVSIDAAGAVSVLSSTVDVGQGAQTALAQIAAAALTLCIERVVVSTPDTDRTPPDQGTVSSRSTFSMGRAIERAALGVYERLTAIAERELEIARADLVLADGHIRPIDGSSPGLPLEELVGASGSDRIAARATFTNESMRDDATGETGISTHHHQAAASALVEVDLETGAVHVREVRVSTHAGVVINPTLAELQSEGNIAFAVGQALMEEIVLEGGQIQNPSLADYMIPSIQDFPEPTRVTFREDAYGDPHGIGETGLPAVLPAITNAVAAALGARLHRLPATPERNLAAVARVGQSELSRTAITDSPEPGRRR